MAKHIIFQIWDRTQKKYLPCDADELLEALHTKLEEHPAAKRNMFQISPKGLPEYLFNRLINHGDLADYGLQGEAFHISAGSLKAFLGFKENRRVYPSEERKHKAGMEKQLKEFEALMEEAW